MYNSLTNQERFSDCELDVGSALLAPLGFLLYGSRGRGGGRG